MLEPGRRQGYAVVAGRDRARLAAGCSSRTASPQAWGLHPGNTLYLGELGPERVVGLVQAPDNVGFPLAKPRFYISRATLDARFGAERDPRVDYAEVWLRDPRYLNEVLVQARLDSSGCVTCASPPARGSACSSIKPPASSSICSSRSR